MKKLNNNKIYIVIFIFCLAIMLISMLSETNIFYIIKEYISSNEYRENYANNADIPIDFDINLMNIIKFNLSNYHWTYDYILIWGTNIFQLLLPVLASISAVLFYTKNQSINKLVINKKRSYKSFIFKEAFICSLKTSISIFLAYIIFYIIAVMISDGALNKSINRSFLSDILGTEFYYKYTQIYYLLDGFIRLFLIPLVYSFFACSMSLFCKNYKQVFLLPIILYFGLVLISLSIRNITKIGMYISPLLVMVPNEYFNINSYCTFIMPLFAILTSICAVVWSGKNVEI